MNDSNFEVKVDIPVEKLKRRGGNALGQAKVKIKQQITKDCNANVPLKAGTMRDSALRWAKMTNDYIKWDTPYAHFQHTGKVMIGEHSHSPWARYGETKVYTNRSLTYRQGGAQWVPKTFSQKKSSWDKGFAAMFKKEWDKG